MIPDRERSHDDRPIIYGRRSAQELGQRIIMWMFFVTAILCGIAISGALDRFVERVVVGAKGNVSLLGVGDGASVGLAGGRGEREQVKKALVGGGGSQITPLEKLENIFAHPTLWWKKFLHIFSANPPRPTIPTLPTAPTSPNNPTSPKTTRNPARPSITLSTPEAIALTALAITPSFETPARPSREMRILLIVSMIGAAGIWTHLNFR